MTWGVEENVHDRFEAAGIPPADIACAPRDLLFPPSRIAARIARPFRHYYGPTMNAFEAAAKEGRADDLHRELADLFDSQNEGSPDAAVIPATYLKVIVTRR